MCKREPQNVEDKNAIAAVKDGFLVGRAKMFQPVDVDVSLITEK